MAQKQLLLYILLLLFTAHVLICKKGRCNGFICGKRLSTLECRGMNYESTILSKLVGYMVRGVFSSYGTYLISNRCASIHVCADQFMRRIYTQK